MRVDSLASENLPVEWGLSAKMKRLMVDIGFLALSYNWFYKAEAIFQGLLSYEKDQEAIYIGLAFSLCGQERHCEALTLLESRCQLDDDWRSSFAHCLSVFRALIMRMMDNAQGALTVLGQCHDWGEHQELAEALRKECVEMERHRSHPDKKDSRVRKFSGPNDIFL